MKKLHRASRDLDSPRYPTLAQARAVLAAGVGALLLAPTTGCLEASLGARLEPPDADVTNTGGVPIYEPDAGPDASVPPADAGQDPGPDAGQDAGDPIGGDAVQEDAGT